MPDPKFSASLRQAGPYARVIDLIGEINSLSSPEMTEVFAQATQGNIRTVLFNFTGVTYLNSFGIGMLVMLLIRARREGINIAGYGLSDHYRNIFKLTRLDEVILLYHNDETALAATLRYDLPEREN
jgi:anti-sigma B factor antagonist